MSDNATGSWATEETAIGLKKEVYVIVDQRGKARVFLSKKGFSDAILKVDYQIATTCRLES